MAYMRDSEPPIMLFGIGTMVADLHPQAPNVLEITEKAGGSLAADRVVLHLAFQDRTSVLEFRLKLASLHDSMPAD